MSKTSKAEVKSATWKPAAKAGGETGTPNILAPAVPPADKGNKTVAVAGPWLRQAAQQIIDSVREHRHLRQARILLTVEHSDATAAKLERGQRVSRGKAGRASERDRLLTGYLKCGDKTTRADFWVRLSGDWLFMVKAAADSLGLAPAVLADRPNKEGAAPPMDPAVALLDHELSHCAAKIAGEFIKSGALEQFVADLGDDHIETCTDVRDKDGSALVRYYATDELGRYQWTIRKHDFEEFQGVVQRRGPWDRQLLRLIDVLVPKAEEPLLGAAGQ